jgi:hypothetical protein
MRLFKKKSSEPKAPRVRRARRRTQEAEARLLETERQIHEVAAQARDDIRRKA